MGRIRHGYSDQVNYLQSMLNRTNLRLFLATALFLTGTAAAIAQPGSWLGCPTTGSAKVGTVEYSLNPLKNRTTKPTAAEIDNSITLDRILQPGNDTARFETTDGAVVEGYVVLVKLAGAETCNCKKTAKKHKDVHIEIAKTVNETNKAKFMVIEITPRVRATMGTAWSVENLKKLKGKKVRFTGWMFYDRIHQNVAKNTAASGNTIHRATAWEVHPVTAWSLVNP